MMMGEFVSMTVINDTISDLSPQPIAWGTYLSDSKISFYLCAFHDMSTEELPEPVSFCANIAALHKNSISPTGQYGFSVCTFHGNLPQDNSWCDTWEEFYTQGSKRMFELEGAQGLSLELRALQKPFYEKVIPRLLRPLETGGRSVKPALVHGDLWYVPTHF